MPMEAIKNSPFVRLAGDNAKIPTSGGAMQCNWCRIDNHSKYFLLHWTFRTTKPYNFPNKYQRNEIKMHSATWGFDRPQWERIQ